MSYIDDSNVGKKGQNLKSMEKKNLYMMNGIPGIYNDMKMDSKEFKDLVSEQKDLKFNFEKYEINFNKRRAQTRKISPNERAIKKQNRIKRLTLLIGHGMTHIEKGVPLGVNH